MAFYRRRRRRIVRRRAVYRRRRRYGAGRRYRRRRGRVNYHVKRLPMLMPDAIRLPMKYTVDVTPTDVVGGFYYVLCMNNPHYNIGYLPMGWSQWAAFYQKFYINTAKIKVTVRCTGSDPGVLNMYPSYGLASSSTNIQASQMPYGRMLTLGDTSMNSTRNRIVQKMSVSKVIGQPLQGENWHGLTSTGMTVTQNQTYWLLYGTVDDGAVDEIKMRIEIIHYTKFYFRQYLSLTST